MQHHTLPSRSLAAGARRTAGLRPFGLRPFGLRPFGLRPFGLLAVLLVFLAPAQEAHAQWAVIDPAHIVKSVYNGKQIVDQLKEQRAQLQAFRDNVRGLASFNFRDMGQFVSQVDRTLASGASLSYSTRNLDGAFNRAYADYGSATPNEAADAYVQRRLDGALSSLRSIREHASQMTGSRRDVQRLQGQIRSSSSAQQIAQVEGSIQAYQAQEMQMVRQMLMLQANQTANDQTQEAAQFQYSREYARALSARNRRQVERMGGRDYNGSIFNR